MGFKPGKPVRNLLYGSFHPEEFIQRKPLVALACYAGLLIATYFIVINYLK